MGVDKGYYPISISDIFNDDVQCLSNQNVLMLN